MNVVDPEVPSQTKQPERSSSYGSAENSAEEKDKNTDKESILAAGLIKAIHGSFRVALKPVIFENKNDSASDAPAKCLHGMCGFKVLAAKGKKTKGLLGFLLPAAALMLLVTR